MGWGRAAGGWCAVMLVGVLAGCDDAPAAEEDDAAVMPDDDAGSDAAAPERARCPGPLHLREPPPRGSFVVADVVESLSGEGPSVSVGGVVHERALYPSWLRHPFADEGPCTLFRPGTACQPECLCTVEGCPDISPVDVGDVTVTGLEVSPLTLENWVPRDHYTVLSPLSVPSSTAGAGVVLSASGGVHEPFEIHAFGVGELEVPEQSIHVEAGVPVSLEWVPGPEDAPLCIRIEVRISELTWIECTVDDTGAFELPAGLVERMLEFDATLTHYAGLYRESRGVTAFEGSEVWLELSSRVELPVEIPGLIACRNAPCPDGMLCDEHYVCRAP